MCHEAKFLSSEMMPFYHPLLTTTKDAPVLCYPKGGPAASRICITEGLWEMQMFDPYPDLLPQIWFCILTRSLGDSCMCTLKCEHCRHTVETFPQEYQVIYRDFSLSADFFLSLRKRRKNSRKGSCPFYEGVLTHPQPQGPF